MIRKLLQEHLVFTKDVYTYYFNDATKNDVLAVENDKGKAKLDMGIYYLNDVPKPNVKNDEVYTILWGLIQKYKAFSYTRIVFVQILNIMNINLNQRHGKCITDQHHSLLN